MIEILLSTFQSERYLEEQINSILTQPCTDWKLLVRDDGSSDNTINILTDYIEKYPSKIELLQIKNEHIGVIKSFENLLNYSKADYIMFCDHDDIWLPDKIEVSLRRMIEMEKANPDTPILVHTDLTIVNSQAKIIHHSFWNFSRLNPELLSNFNYLGVCNGITGCTTLINIKAKVLCLPFSNHIHMHDSWIALCISKFGKIVYINKPTILYRQHELNQIGAREVKSAFEYLRVKFINLKKVLKENKKQLLLLKELNYGTNFKYYYFKVLYFIKARL